MSEFLSRSMLFAPASRREMIEKAATSTADSVCIDLEDSIAPALKEQVRGDVIRALRELEFGHRARIVRINGMETAWAYRDLVEVIEGAGDRLDLVMIPKVRHADDVRFVDTMLTQIEARQGLARRIGLQAQIESASGFLHVREIAASSPRLTALIFGAGDYAASMRMPLVNIGVADEFDAAVPGHRWHAVMHAIVAAARTNGLNCLDGPFARYQDEAALQQACVLARAMGFDGKQSIHPAQLSTINAVFSPHESEVKRAREVVEAYEAAMRGGQGAVGIQGTMIDAVNLRMARTILGAHDAIVRRG
jgi:citrate lyase subunit beta/citryl-CoA lyase